jgi:hypothetical protein
MVKNGKICRNDERSKGDTVCLRLRGVDSEMVCNGRVIHSGIRVRGRKLNAVN